MGNEGTHHLEQTSYYTIKVHRLMCLELKNFVDRISQIFSAIESARPRCSAGLQALCALHVAMDKARLLIQHCSECSKLYLAFKADRILLRCENIRNALDLCLGQIQNMVPTFLAAKISGIVEDLRGTKFCIEFSEEEAGKAVKELIRQDIPASDSINESEIQALEFAAVRLKITSPLAVLIEKRSIKKLHDKVRDTDPKKKILEYLFYLLRKYGGSIGQFQTEGDLARPRREEYESQTENSATPEPPLEFKCPISMRLMFDPVIIASGKSYERVWIEKWFSEGNDRCPITHARLENLLLTPNIAMKGLISKWCSEQGITISEPCVPSIPAPVFAKKLLSFRSIASIGSSIHDLRLQVSNVSLRSSGTNSGSGVVDDDNNVDFSVGLPQMTVGACINHLSVRGRSISLASISKLDSLPWESQCEAVNGIMEQLDKNEQADDFMFNSSYVKPLIKFLKDACDFCDVKAQKESADVLFTILTKSRVELRPFNEDAIYMLASFLDSEITSKALVIMEVLSCQPFYKSGIVASGVLPSVLKVLDSQTEQHYEIAMKILSNLSCNIDVAHHIVYLDCIPKLVPFLGDKSLAGYCLSIMNTLCEIDEGRNAIAETNSCIASIATLIETGRNEEQETAMEVLLSLCYEHAEHCRQVTGEGIIRTLFSISRNRKPRGKVIATELLQMLGQTTKEGDVSDCSVLSSGFSLNTSSDSGSSDHSKRKKSPFGYMRRKIRRLFQQAWVTRMVSSTETIECR